MEYLPIFVMALIVAGIALAGAITLHLGRQRIADPRAANRADWARSRRHWAGAPDLREGGE